jgi:hypothetical protein
MKSYNCFLPFLVFLTLPILAQENPAPAVTAPDSAIIASSVPNAAPDTLPRADSLRTKHEEIRSLQIQAIEFPELGIVTYATK